MRINLKKLGYNLIALVMLITLFSGYEMHVTQAATAYKEICALKDWYKEKDRTVGKTIFEFDDSKHTLYAIKNGKKILLAANAKLDPTIFTNGTVVYYYLNSYDDSIDNHKSATATVYRISAIGKKGEKLFSTKTGYGFYFQSLYKGKIYYTKYTDFGGETGMFCSYTLKSKKQETIVKKDVTEVDQYNNYFYLTPYCGDGSPVWLRVYNAKNGKVKTIVKKQIAYRIIDGSLYYAEVKREMQPDYGMKCNIAIKKCSLGGGNKRTLLRSLDVRRIEKISKYSVTYYDLNENKKTKKF